MQRPTFDDKDAAILQQHLAIWNQRKGPRIGDFIEMLDGTYRRITVTRHKVSLQVTKDGTRGAFYFGNGYTDFSGASLPIIIPRHLVSVTDKMKDGEVWFFHHNQVRAHNRVNSVVSCRVYQERLFSDLNNQ